MHGKIVTFQDATGKGVATNHFKKLFSFSRTTWHDPKALPTKGLLVEFRADGDQILDIHASRYQTFTADSLVSESDFWHTDTDDELADKEERKRFAKINDIYKSTDYATLNDVPVSLPIAQAVKNYFVLENTAIAMIDELPQDIEHMLDYLLLKRFLLRALDTLLFMDRTHTRDYFLRYTTTITRLENSYRILARINNFNVVPVFEEFFLRYQIHYQALCSAITSSREGHTMLERQKQSAAREIKFLQKQIDTKQAKPDAPERIKELSDNIGEQQKQIASAQTQIQKLEELRDNFYKRNLETFELVLNTSYERLLRKLKNGLNISSTLLDDEIWKLSANSSSIRVQFFRNGGEENICTYSFAKFYLRHLDTKVLQGTDHELEDYCKKIHKTSQKYFLIVSDNLDFITNVKVQILTQAKFNQCKQAEKVIALHSLLRDFAFTQIIIDKNTKWLSTNEIIATIAEFPKNKTTDIKVTYLHDKSFFPLKADTDNNEITFNLPTTALAKAEELWEQIPEDKHEISDFTQSADDSSNS